MSANSAKKLPARLSAVVAAALTAGAAAAALGLTPASAATTANWVLTGWNIHQLNQLNPTLASHFFNTPRSYATGPNTSASPIADSFTATGVLVYNSYAQFTADLASHAIAPAYTWVMYHPAYWAATPRNEQQNPARYLPRFGQLAHTHPWQNQHIPAPHADRRLLTPAYSRRSPARAARPGRVSQVSR